MNEKSIEWLREREAEIAKEVRDSERIIANPSPGDYVSRKCLAADRRFLKELRREIKSRN